MVRKAGLLQQLGSAVDDFKEGFRADYGIGGEDARSVAYRKRELQGKQKEAPKIVAMGESYPLQRRVRELAGQASPAVEQALNEADMALRKDKSKAYQAGQLTGTLAADITQDASRRFYWLLNAAQATGEIVNEVALARANPDLYRRTLVRNAEGRPVKRNSKEAVDLGVIKSLGTDEQGKEIYEPRRGYQYDPKQGGYTKRNFEPEYV